MLQPKQLSLTPNQVLRCSCTRVVLFLKRINAETTMKASFLRKRKMARGVLVLDGSLAGLEPYLANKNFRVIALPMGAMDTDRKAMIMTNRTLITTTPQDFEYE